ncbi:MAG: mechanosensitive ion channel family protein [Bacillota bacterium]|nr:mechanosensitive ion channel family protein [Bacillota bacterium]
MWETIKDWLEQTEAISIFITSVLVIFGALIVYRIVSSLIIRTFQRSFSWQSSDAPHNRGETLGHLINSVIKYVLIFIVIVVILGRLGVNVASIIATAGVLGLAVSFGAQTLVKDIIAGFFIIMENQYGVGEYVSINQNLGIVEAVEMRITKVKGFDGELYIIPNGSITDVVNYCRDHMRVKLDFGISYDSDIDKAENIIREAASAYYETHQDIMAGEPVVVGVEALMDFSVNIRLIAYTEPMTQWDVARGLRKAVKQALDAEGIKIPFPVQEIIHGEDEPHEKKQEEHDA